MPNKGIYLNNLKKRLHHNRVKIRKKGGFKWNFVQNVAQCYFQKMAS